MKCLVLGSSGMAGHVISCYLKEKRHEVFTQSHTTKTFEDTVVFDIRDRKKLNTLLQSNSFDVVINCIGLLVRESDNAPSLAIYLNSYLPKSLEDYYKKTSTKVIHISSDGVFSGQYPTYNENSSYDSNTVYGRTKALGEINNAKDLTLRMSIIGPELRPASKSLFGWFYSQEGVVNGYQNSIWKGITTIELAKAICQILTSNLSSIYNLVPNGSISKYDLLSLIAKEFRLDKINLQPVNSEKSHNLSLINTRIDFNYVLPTYEIMIKEMHTWIISHREYYPHYAEK